MRSGASTTRAGRLDNNVIYNIRVLRGERGWTQQQLADRLQAAGLNWSRGTLAHVEAGEGNRTRVSVDELYTLARVFDVPADSLVSRLHDYLSTACLHGEHDQCRNTCKFCGTRCSCRTCHPEPEITDQPPTVMTAATDA